MKVLVSGSTGLIGSAAVPFLMNAGHDVACLVRSARASSAGDVPWDPRAAKLDPASLEGIDAVVHLAGESISQGRWTTEKKVRIRNSRVEGTRLLAQTLAALEHPPQALVCASAIGFYGDRSADLVDEDSAPGAGFLAEVCQEWEAATQPATERGVRVVHLRLGVVLSPAGGALATMLVSFRLGLGGTIGSGEQYMSWIALDDAVGAIQHALATQALAGPVNAVAPNPVTNREFTSTLGRILSRPALLAIPAFGARLIFGEMADALLLSSARVKPHRLAMSGYQFRFPELEPALRHLLCEESRQQSP